MKFVTASLTAASLVALVAASPVYSQDSTSEEMEQSEMGQEDTRTNLINQVSMELDTLGVDKSGIENLDDTQLTELEAMLMSDQNDQQKKMMAEEFIQENQ